MNLVSLKSAILSASLICSAFYFISPSMAQMSPVAASIAVFPFNSLQQPGPQKNKQQNLIIKSAQQASSRAQSQFGGKVLRVQSSQINGNPGYRVKLLSHDGVVFYASVNAVTGAVSRN
ncbi:PepSY domain-containing protein [Shewanella subflava]|uniref:PepSY domain-containing protein n=1 Tax=Shewanella subflava TaxID=2986476 RepID=A0ABT3IBW8_9GAMM|nr:PepSY domain-containing protein [Shewanella subflava]MCW3173551.1 PepSY domain-containing protein [Shewanella subflava]